MPTHGSLTKAGKVRSQTPNIENTSSKKSLIPRIKNRRNYIRRILKSAGNTFSRGGRRPS